MINIAMKVLKWHFMIQKFFVQWQQVSLDLSVVADSLSAIKYAKVKPIRDENGIAVDFEIEGDFPKYGNNDDRVDEIAVESCENIYEKTS